MKVVRVRGGTMFHVVHETQTHARRATAYVICSDQEQDVAEMRDGSPTCSKCVQLDDPLKLNAHEQKVIEILAHGHPIGIAKPASVRRLGQLDLIHYQHKEQLTRRGKILALDFTEGTAPWFDDNHVGHYRLPLSGHLRCGSPSRPDMVAVFYDMTVERYGKLRKAGGVVTCLACLGLAR